MATEPEIQATDEVVHFDEKQQAKMDEYIRKASARAGAEARTEAEKVRREKADLERKLEEQTALTEKAKKAAPRSGDDTDVEALKAQMEEVKKAGLATSQQLESAQRLLASKDKDIKAAETKTLEVMKTTTLKEAAQAKNFVNSDLAIMATKDSVKWDETSNQFIVVDPATGTQRMNREYNPMTLDEYYTEFAQKNPYLVRGDVPGGTGQSVSQRWTGSANGKFTVDQIFGRKSNSKLANDLYRADLPEYHRLKAIAKTQGLI
jgi:hypothetical protein